MGDRGGTATYAVMGTFRPYYTRWEIGGEPQLELDDSVGTPNYTRWEIGGEPQQEADAVRCFDDYTRWEIGGEPQPCPSCS